MSAHMMELKLPVENWRGDEIICPRHGARFCVKTGAVKCAPAYEDIATFPIRIEQGRLQVRDDRWD